MHERAKRHMHGQFDFGEITPQRYFASIAVVVGLLFAFISGAESGAPSLPMRLLQWQLQSCLPMALMVLSQLLLARMPWFEKLHTWLRLLLSGFLGATLFTPLALAIDVWLYGDAVGAAQLLEEFTGVVPPVVLCWLAINAPWVMGFRLQSVSSGGDEEAPAASAGGSASELPFLQLVPRRLRGELLYLEAELHYVAVVTARGRSLILYNLRDAITELGAREGIQPHRSFWVAATQVTGFKRRGRQGVLQMRNGDEVPVSRRNLQQVQSWYDGLEPAC